MKDFEAANLLKQHENDTRELAKLVIQTYDFAVIINRLANYILDEPNSDNARYEAEEAIKIVLPYL